MGRPTDIDLPTEPMDVDAFLDWVDRQPKGFRYELSDGFVVVDQASETVRHARAKFEAALALRNAVRGLDCEALPDSVGVTVGQGAMRIPDAMLRCGPPLADEATRVDDPVVVVEVLSPSTAAIDLGEKLIEYGRVEGLAHYLIVDPKKRVAIHHRRTAEGWITTIRPGGALTLDPPGITLDLDPIVGAFEPRG